MPNISNNLHGMDNLELDVTVVNGSAGPFATLGLHNPVEGSKFNWTFFFESVDSIREFYQRLGAALDEYDRDAEAEKTCA